MKRKTPRTAARQAQRAQAKARHAFQHTHPGQPEPLILYIDDPTPEKIAGLMLLQNSDAAWWLERSIQARKLLGPCEESDELIRILTRVATQQAAAMQAGCQA